MIFAPSTNGARRSSGAKDLFVFLHSSEDQLAVLKSAKLATGMENAVDHIGVAGVEQVEIVLRCFRLTVACRVMVVKMVPSF